MFWLLYPFIYIFSLLPLAVLYRVSDVMYLILGRMVRYRRKVVAKNIRNSFPDMSEKERKAIERRFYKWLCDYIVETMKLVSADNKTVSSMIEYSNVEVLENWVSTGKSCAIFGAHYCNWEFLTTIPVGMRNASDTLLATIYHPLRNKTFDRIMISVRQRNHSVCIPKQKILRYIKAYKDVGISVMYGYCFDQTPKWENIHQWVPFLNQDTPVFSGAERISRKHHHAAFFLNVSRSRRGLYHCEIKLLTEDAASLPEGRLTKMAFCLLEEEIKRQPEFYLWSHNRWKRTRQEWELRKEKRQKK